MRKTTDLFLIDGKPMLAPDKNMQMVLQDVEAADSCRDESGFLHRFNLRQGVGTWDFFYDYLTDREYAYMESLFAGKDTFRFTCPDWENNGAAREITAYRSQHKILLQRAQTGCFHNYQFSVRAC